MYLGVRHKYWNVFTRCEIASCPTRTAFRRVAAQKNLDHSCANMTIMLQMFENKVQYNTVKYSTIQYNTREWLRAEMTTKCCGKTDEFSYLGLPRVFHNGMHEATIEHRRNKCKIRRVFSANSSQGDGKLITILSVRWRLWHIVKSRRYDGGGGDSYN